MGAWSARHRVTAVASWLLLVGAGVLIGSAVGQVTMTRAEYGTAESGRAQWLLTNAGVAPQAEETVLVHSSTATADSSGFRSAV